VSSLAVAALTAGATFLATRWKVSKDFDIEIARAVRSDRIEVYPKLWALTERLAFYAKERDLTYSDALDLGSALRRWYYQEGGIFLSENSRDAYFELHEALKAVYTSKPVQSEPLKPREFFSIQRPSSNLRTALARDLGTRRGGVEEAKAKD
jgi:hypothetical protein